MTRPTPPDAPREAHEAALEVADHAYVQKGATYVDAIRAYLAHVAATCQMSPDES